MIDRLRFLPVMLIVLGGMVCCAPDACSDEQAAIQAAVARVAPCTVRIEAIGLTSGKEAAAGAGPSTGLIVGADGWIVTTSFAVTKETVEVVVVLADGSRRSAKVVGRDLARTIVLLKIDPPAPLPVPVMAPKSEIRVGQWAIALGRAWSASQASVSVGVISAVERGWGKAVQTDAAVSPANYGGPLVDITGRVIGVLAPIPADTAGMMLGTELYDSGIGFAVPLEDIVRRLPRLAAGRTIAPGLLGITYASKDPFTQPAVIATSRSGSPAAKAGLRTGDRIVGANGRDVTRIAELRHVLSELSAGDVVRLSIERAGGGAQRLEKEITLVEDLPPYRRPCLGIGLVRTSRTASPTGEAPPADATKVAWVWPKGPAAKAGLLPGDRIVAIEPIAAGVPPGGAGESSPQPDASALAGIVAGGEIGTAFRVKYVRDGAERSAEIVAGAVPVGLPDASLVLPAAPRLDEGGKKGGVERLTAPDLANPPVVVLPRTDPARPIGVLLFLAASRKDAEAAAARWQTAADSMNVAVVIPASTNPLRWATDDIPSIGKAMQALAGRRAIDRGRVAVVGMQSGGGFAWTVAESLGNAIRGIAVLDGGLPRRGAIASADPDRPLSVLLARPAPDAVEAEAALRRLEADVERLGKAGVPVGLIPEPVTDPIPYEAICRWVETLGML